MTTDIEASPGDGTIVSSVRLDYPSPDFSLREITYNSDGLHVKGALIVPGSGGPYPGLIYCRGGIGNFGMVRMNHAAALASKGYAVFAPYYRGSSSGEGIDRFGGEDRRDVYNAITLLRSLPEASRDPVALVGFSRGAIMALLAARDCADAGPAAVWNGVSDLLLTYEERVDMRRMLKRVVGHPRKDRDAYIERSPLAWADRIRRPVLILHGTADDNVSVEHGRLLAGALEQAKAEHRLTLFEGLGHLFPAEEEARAIDAIHEWFAGHRTASAIGG
ncbi:alpha/beta hydrolase family protein [Paenibacillus sp. MBLB4367]|uniref:alpha/beta hydrolase family protein n=1 Tax=Paenibacillus sp. MBLB4367 TaxID=3384767 RepID=UPI0039081892